MKAFIHRHHRIIFYSEWFLISIIQAAYTELQDDEAYYWVFSRFLDWGYFDHPPMTALLIKMGYTFFRNELGVRLLMVVINTCTVFICEKITGKKDPWLFYVVCLSLAVLQIAGFMAVPDIPLMFFTALFFWVYKKFVSHPGWLHTVLLSLVTTCLLYSKYHAVLVIFFTLISHLPLFKKWQTYVAGIIAFILFIPHLWWQYQHDWISFRYHLFESNVNPYKFSYTTDYLLGQLLIAGPLAGFIFWYATFRYPAKSPVERALKFTGIGIFFFFLLSTFKGKVEANWTAPAIIPIIILSHQYLLTHTKARHWIYRLLLPTLLLVVALRVIMIVNIVPANAVVERFHSWKGWPQQLRQKTQGLPVVISSSYQNASKYWFYTGQTTYSLNEYRRRRNNYNFWPIEDSLLGKPVYIFNPDAFFAKNDSMHTPIGDIRYALDSSFHSFTKIIFRTEQDSYTIKENEKLRFRATIRIPENYRFYLSEHPEVNFPVKVGVFDKQKWIKDLDVPVSLQQLIQQPQLTFTLQPALPRGSYFLRFAIGSDAGWFTHNSDKIKLLVE